MEAFTTHRPPKVVLVTTYFFSVSPEAEEDLKCPEVEYGLVLRHEISAGYHIAAPKV